MNVHDELQDYLDGERTLDELPLRLREEAAEWDDLLESARSLGPAGAPLGFDRRVMARIRDGSVAAVSPESRDERMSRPRWMDWLVRPRPIRISPLAMATAAAAVLVLAVVPRLGRDADTEITAGGTGSTVYVQFVVAAPLAESVELVGDFNGWQPTISLEDLDGDGVWTGRVPLKPGVHEYMFVLDGKDWVSDPNAERHSDDGFGQQNSVVAIPEPASGV